MRRHGGWILMDTLVAILLIGIMAGIILVAIKSQALALRVLLDCRSAFRTAEWTFADLQSNRPIPNDPNIQVLPLANAALTQTMRWAEVTVKYKGIRGQDEFATLVGLAPSAALRPFGAKP